MPPPEVAEKLARQTSNPLVDIFNGDVPLGGVAARYGWSLLSLLMAVMAAAVSLLCFLSLFARRPPETDEEDETDEEGETQLTTPKDQGEWEETTEKRRLLAPRIATIVLGVLAGILFLIWEDTRLPTVLITRWTPWIGLVFLLHVVALILSVVLKKRVDSTNEPDTPENEELAPGD